MGITLIKNGDSYDSSAHKQFQISSQEELAALPGCAVGSIAYLNDLNKIWMLDADGNWNEI